MRSLLSIAAALLCCSTLTARADTFELFNLSATLANGGTITGTVDLDLSSTLSHDPFDSTANLIYTLNTTSTPIVGPSVGFVFSIHDDGGIIFSLNPAAFPAPTFTLLFPTTTPGAFAGVTGGLCLGGCPDGPNYVSFISEGISTPPIDVTSGTFLPADATPATTPEPASLMLLGTGALAMFGLFRRRV